jgi:hypothetical protein
MLSEGVSQYYVPAACIQCHGSDSDYGRLNHLDTDHLIDRTQPGEDFEAVGRSNWGVLFDAGKERDTPRFTQAFEVIRRLNKEMNQQNASVDKLLSANDGETAGAPENTASFQTRAVKTWLQIHEGGATYRPPLERGILGTDGKTRWSPDELVDRKLLPLLNRFCYRCHSSLLYHVFDKQAVIENAFMMRYLIEQPDYESFRMPQDRELSSGQKQELIRWLTALEEEAAQ